MISLNGSFQNGNTKSGNVQTSFSDYVSGSLSYSQQYPKLALGWSSYINANYCDTGQFDSFFWGPGFSLNKSFWKNKLTHVLSCSYNDNKSNGNSAGSLLNTSLSMVYQVKALKEKLGKHSFSLNANMTNHFGKQSTENSRAKEYEFLTTLTYKVNF